MTNTQKLKAVAELLGYDALSFISFDPRKNSEQLIQVEGFLLIRGAKLERLGDGRWCWEIIRDSATTKHVYAESRAQAAINAAAEIGGR